MGQRVVINKCTGGFCLSRRAFLRLRELGCAEALSEPDVGEGWSDDPDGVFGTRDDDGSFGHVVPRDSPLLVQVLDEMGAAANGDFAILKIVEIPDGVEWDLAENEQGQEWIAEKHRTWS